MPFLCNDGTRHDLAEKTMCDKARIVARALAMGWMCYAGNYKDVSTSQL
jgi:hypothetical protein